jgi:hypothetical protein
MAQAVQFTNHAADRLQQRFGLKVQTGVDVDISATFRPTGRTYIHNQKGTLVQQFIPKDLSIRMVMEVCMDSMAVITVMASGPVVDAVYRKVAH